ncbi:MAG: thiolase domain-containing protein [Nitrospinota bacterium]
MSSKVRRVAILGVGLTRFGVRSESLSALVAQACEAALADGGVDRAEVEAFYLGNFAAESFTGQSHLAPYAARALGLRPVPCTRVEGACASGGLALRQGVLAVASGAHDLVLVAGAEKMTSVDTRQATHILSCAGDWEVEVNAGATFPALFALIARRYLHQFDAPREALAAVAVKNQANGLLNPNAHLRKPLTLEQALGGRPVAEPLGVYDCSLISDGAAACVLCPWERARAYRDGAVEVLASSQASDALALEEKAEITRLDATVEAGRRAFDAAGLSPSDVDLAEVHDCFTIAEILAVEDLGFFPKGAGFRAALEGWTSREGRLPVNTSGGLKAKGHPVGATGLAQVHELVVQLRGEAGERQVGGAEVGLAQNLGGSGATCVVHILGPPR